jgi:hypothetical protein
VRPSLAFLAAVLAALLLAPAADARRPRAVLAACERAHHAATFEGRMDARAGAQRMRMRFRLQERTPDVPRWTRVRVPGFARAHTSDPGVVRYVYTKRVEGLVGPAAYRVVVRFRWLAGDGTVVHRARATSRACRAPDPRPDLRVSAVDVRPAPAVGQASYAVTVRNAGRSPAAPSRVQLDLGSGTPLSGDIGELGRREAQTVVLDGPACASGSAITALADADDAVEEHDEDDNALVVVCP